LPRLQKYLEQRSPGAITINGISPQQLAVGLGLATTRGESAVPTVAGLMIFGLHPQWAMPEWSLSALRISGLDITDPIADRAECEGTADQLIEQGEAFVRRNLRVAAVFEDTGQYIQRQDVPEYPLFAAREAIANAVAHRDYSLPERITLRIFDDRLEVSNPGGLIGGLRLEELLQEGGRSMPRNRIIADFLRERGKMETVGRGLLRIQREMRELGSEPPVFRDERTRFVVVLPSRHKSIPGLQKKSA
jgi:ATP-dependent DNA helicase RecG